MLGMGSFLRRFFFSFLRYRQGRRGPPFPGKKVRDMQTPNRSGPLFSVVFSPLVVVLLGKLVRSSIKDTTNTPMDSQSHRDDHQNHKLGLIP
jgi:hypothetical protein